MLLAAAHRVLERVLGNRSVRVAVLDDHPIIVAALEAAIGRTTDLEFCGGACDLMSLRARLRGCRPDVLVMDICLAEEHALDVLPSLRKDFPSIRVLAYSLYDPAIYAAAALIAGASGYVPKSAPTTELLDAIRIVHRGGSYFPYASRPAPVLVEDQLLPLSWPLTEQNPPETVVQPPGAL